MNTVQIALQRRPPASTKKLGHLADLAAEGRLFSPVVELERVVAVPVQLRRQHVREVRPEVRPVVVHPLRVAVGLGAHGVAENRVRAFPLPVVHAVGGVLPPEPVAGQSPDLLDERDEARAFRAQGDVQGVVRAGMRHGQSRQLRQSGEEVDGLHQLVRGVAGSHLSRVGVAVEARGHGVDEVEAVVAAGGHAGDVEYHGDSQGHLEVGVLAPLPVVAQVPACTRNANKLGMRRRKFKARGSISLLCSSFLFLF